jgi:AP-4 complex subunit beta-1
LNDIKKYLKSIQSDPEKEFQRKEIIKKIISYTTIGIDTSRLYPEVVMASATRDPVEKKLVYLYLSIYSNTNQNFARMTINTFLKDISSPNPNVRALAIRSLSNLRFKGRD